MLCAFCEREFTPKRPTGKYCSTRCRCAAWQRRRVAMPAAEARAIRARLTTALEAVWDAKTTLERYGG
jgi:hypothetical protein